jgi:hypothetical protein
MIDRSDAASKPVRVVGIDLGTTNSTIAEARWEPACTAPTVRCVEVEQSTLEGAYTHVLFPSVVAIHEGRVWVGEGAKRLHSRASSGAMGFFRPVLPCRTGLRMTAGRRRRGSGQPRGLAAGCWRRFKTRSAAATQWTQPRTHPVTTA